MLNEVKYVPLIIALFFINILIGNKIIIRLFNNNSKNEIKLLIVQTIIINLINIICSEKLCRLIYIFVELILYKKILKLSAEKLFLAEIINSIIITTSECFFTYYILAEFVIKLIIFFIIKYRKINFELNVFLEGKEKIKIGTISIFSLVIIEIIKNISWDYNIVYKLLTNLMIIAYLIILIKNILLNISRKNAIIEIENLELSNKRLQENYDNVRAFKHDFNNIMQGIGGYIVENDIKGLTKMYKSIIKECQEINDKQTINKDIINNPAILNLINNKIKLAEENDVKIKVEVYVDLNSINISTYDLCRILGILLDNAIEACIGCEEKIVTIKFIKDKFNNRILIVIENPCKNYLIDVKKIYEKGISSKKDKVSHGLGLWKVKQILKKNKNIQIYTSRDKLFKQQLEIY